MIDNNSVNSPILFKHGVLVLLVALRAFNDGSYSIELLLLHDSQFQEGGEIPI